MSIVLQGSTSGSVTLQEPAVAGSTVLTLPAISGTILTTGSSGQSIPKAALPTGSVLQVVQTVYTTQTSLNSTSYTDISGFSASITPTSATSKILVMVSANVSHSTPTGGYLALLRGSTNITSPNGFWFYAGNANTNYGGMAAIINLLDSPATTSSTTYKMQWKCDNANPIYINRSEANAGLSGISCMTLLEIAA